MNKSNTPDPTPQPQELDSAIQRFGKPMEPARKEKLMERLQQERSRFKQNAPAQAPATKKKSRGR